MNYSGEEIIQIAIGEEKDAIDFYRVAMENSNSPETRELFQFLLSEEERHLGELDRDILPIFQGASFSWEDEDVISAYLRSLGKSGALHQGPKPAEFARSHRDPLGVIDFAIGLEKRAIDFYKNVETASAESGRKALRRVIEEEGTHIHRLNEVRKRIGK